MQRSGSRDQSGRADSQRLEIGSQPRCIRIGADHADDLRAAAHRDDVVGDVGGAAEPVLLVVERHNRHRRFGRDAVDAPDDEVIEHHVADNEDDAVAKSAQEVSQELARPFVPWSFCHTSLGPRSRVPGLASRVPGPRPRTARTGNTCDPGPWYPGPWTGDPGPRTYDKWTKGQRDCQAARNGVVMEACAAGVRSAA